MTANGKRVPSKMVPFYAIMPLDADRPQLQAFAQWYSPAGIMLPRRPVVVGGFTPEMVVQMFIELANQGLVQQTVEEEGVKVTKPIPAMDLTLVAPKNPWDQEDPPPEDPKPEGENRIVTV
jgi:hypothetical protein